MFIQVLGKARLLSGMISRFATEGQAPDLCSLMGVLGVHAMEHGSHARFRRLMHLCWSSMW